MPGPTIQWTPIDTTEVLSEIREEGRYRLASPSAVTGAPSLAMQAAGQNCTVKVYIGGVYRSDALLTVPSTAPVAIRNAVGQPLTGQEMFDMVIEVGNLGFGSVLLTTDEPNGSPSAPFTTEAERTAWATANLATLRSGVSTVWGPGAVEYVWNGPLATDWQGIRGPYLGSAENPFAATTTLAELGALAMAGPDEIWIVNPCVPRGKSRLIVNAARTAYYPSIGECIVDITGIPISQVTPGVLTLTEIYGANVGASPTVHDALIPIGGVIELSVKAYVRNSVAPAGASIIGACFSGSIPNKTGVHEYPQAASVTPDPAGYGISEIPSILLRASAKFTHGTQGGRSILAWEHPFVAGDNRIWVMAKPSNANDIIAVQRIYACYKGGAM